MVSPYHLISKSSSPFTNTLGIVPIFIIGITVNLFFLVPEQGLDIYLTFHFLLILLCSLPGQQSLLFGGFYFFFFFFFFFVEYYNYHYYNFHYHHYSPREFFHLRLWGPFQVHQLQLRSITVTVMLFIFLSSFATSKYLIIF